MLTRVCDSPFWCCKSLGILVLWLSLTIVLCEGCVDCCFVVSSPRSRSEIVYNFVVGEGARKGRVVNSLRRKEEERQYEEGRSCGREADES